MVMTRWTVKAGVLILALACGIIGNNEAGPRGTKPGSRSSRAGTSEQQRGMPLVKAVISPPVASTGEKVLVQVQAANLPEAHAFAFHLVYDPEMLEPIPGSFAEGSMLARGSSSTQFLASIASTGERILVGASRLGNRRTGPSGGLVATFTFRALLPGRTSIHLDQASVSDANAEEIPARFLPGRLRVRKGKRRNPGR